MPQVELSSGAQYHRIKTVITFKAIWKRNPVEAYGGPIYLHPRSTESSPVTDLEKRSGAGNQVMVVSRAAGIRCNTNTNTASAKDRS